MPRKKLSGNDNDFSERDHLGRIVPALSQVNLNDLSIDAVKKLTNAGFDLEQHYQLKPTEADLQQMQADERRQFEELVTNAEKMQDVL